MRWRRAIAREIAVTRTVHCKAVRCNAMLRLGPDSITSALHCQECGNEFCCDCDYPAPHAPATCEMVAKWRDKVREGLNTAPANSIAPQPNPQPNPTPALPSPYHPITPSHHHAVTPPPRRLTVPAIPPSPYQHGVVEVSGDDEASMLEISKLSTRCPKCGHAIIKQDGTCNHMTCDPGASGCSHHFCYLCAADWDRSAYKCTNSKCPSSRGGGGNIYATGDVASTDELHKLSTEANKYIVSLKRATVGLLNPSLKPGPKSSPAPSLARPKPRPKKVTLKNSPAPNLARPKPRPNPLPMSHPLTIILYGICFPT